MARPIRSVRDHLARAKWCCARRRARHRTRAAPNRSPDSPPSPSSKWSRRRSLCWGPRVALDWNRTARRIRIPLGFAFAIVYFWLAQPTWPAIIIGLAIATLGLWLRAYASGYVKKASEL